MNSNRLHPSKLSSSAGVPSVNLHSLEIGRHEKQIWDLEKMGLPKDLLDMQTGFGRNFQANLAACHLEREHSRRAEEILTWRWRRLMTRAHWIANEPRQALANGCMINNTTFSVYTTCSRARINTFHIDAGPRFATIAVNDTLGTTFNIRITKIFRNTFTCGCTITFFA